ncbi:hypothetical protein [Bacillus pumilus]|uniref:hypothetical protein n=1 Tax=Bacillus pumilus TaxID=1408 RepID=UPI0011A322CE|nr:hypothetical protein [Bacillus pumilus]
MESIRKFGVQLLKWFVGFVDLWDVCEEVWVIEGMVVFVWVVVKGRWGIHIKSEVGDENEGEGG